MKNTIKNLHQFVTSTFVIVLLSLMINQFAYGQDSIRITENGSKLILLEDKVKALQTEVKILNDVNGRILDSVYWSIGIIVTVLIGFGLLNYFSTIKINKVKLEEISNKLKSEFTESEKNIKKSFNSLVDDNTKKFKENDSSVSKKISSQLESKLYSIKNELGNIQTQVNANSICHYENNSNYDQQTYCDKYTTLGNLREMLKLEIQMRENYSTDYHVDFHKRLDAIHKHVKKHKMELYAKERLVEVLDKLPEQYNEASQIIRNDIQIGEISKY